VSPPKAPPPTRPPLPAPADKAVNVASLASGPPQADVTKSVQAELRRVGCLTGSADGDWNNASQRSLTKFNRYAGTRLDTKVASVDTLDTLKLKSSRVCPLVCEHGFQADGDRCTKIVCAEGSFLNDDNECEKRRAKRPVAARERPESRRVLEAKARSASDKASLYHGFSGTDGWCRRVVFGSAAHRPGTRDGLPLVRRHHVGRVPLALHGKTVVTRLVRNCALERVTQYQCALLGDCAALLPWSRIENRAVDLAGGVANEGDPRMIAALDMEFILRKERHGHRLTLVEIEDRPAARGFNDKLAVRDTDLKRDTVRGDRLPGKGYHDRIVLPLADDLELDGGVDRT
jgi:hypothetical protein